MAKLHTRAPALAKSDLLAAAVLVSGRGRAFVMGNGTGKDGAGAGAGG